MRLRDRLAAYQQPFIPIVAVASCRDSLFFADLCWPQFDGEAELRRSIDGLNPGVIFETPTRMVVIEEHSGELRYYAGGWRSHESRIHLEQDRIWAEGSELGVFSLAQDAILFAEQFLVRQQALQDIETPRLVRHRRQTDKDYQTSNCT